MAGFAKDLEFQSPCCTHRHHLAPLYMAPEGWITTPCVLGLRRMVLVDLAVRSSKP